MYFFCKTIMYVIFYELTFQGYFQEYNDRRISILVAAPPYWRIKDVYLIFNK